MPARATPELFWSKVERRGPDECWPWKAARTPLGYGRLRYHMEGWKAHRLAWTLTNGDAGDMQVCHSCDNPPCCNPAHLFLGTAKDNMQDMARKGRHPRNATNYLPTGEKHHGRRTPEVMARGEANGSAVLTEDQVKEIRLGRANGETHRSLASRFGVAKGTIAFIVSGQTWRHLLPKQADAEVVRAIGQLSLFDSVA